MAERAPEANRHRTAVRRRLAARSLLLASLAVAAVACGDDDDDGGAAAESGSGVVVVNDNVFEPKETTVAVGDTVTWQFEGNSAHNVTFDDGESSKLQKDGEFERTFDEAGSFDYSCTVHPGMSGTVEVTES